MEKDSKWLSIHVSKESMRDIADQAIITAAVRLDITTNKNIKFVFISKDNFVFTLRDDINEFSNRKIDITERGSLNKYLKQTIT